MSYLKFDWPLWKSGLQVLPPVAGTQMQTITIFGEDCEVTAHKTGMATWKAYGYANGRPVQATDDTAAAVFSRWRNLAKASDGRPGSTPNLPN